MNIFVVKVKFIRYTIIGDGNEGVKGGFEI